MNNISRYNSPLGEIIIASRGNAIIGLWFSGQKYLPKFNSIDYVEADTAVIIKTKSWLDIYFLGSIPDFTLPLDYGEVSEFRRRVWDILLTIPYGSTTSYGAIAKQFASERGRIVSAQAVGGAIGHNAISILIPCHRVLGTDGSITGYAGGVDRKVALLNIETKP